MSSGQAISSIDAVVLDLDGLLLDTERLYAQAWTMAASALGVDIDTLTLKGLRGCSAVEWESQMKGGIIPLHHWTQFMAGAERIWQNIIKSQEVACMPGAMELLAFLDHDAIPYLVATNSPRAYAAMNIAASAMRLKTFTLLCREDVVRPKPDPAIILLAASTLQTSPSRVAVIEDSATGIQAAVSAGAICIYVHDHPEEASQVMAHLSCDDLHACSRELRRMLGRRGS